MFVCFFAKRICLQTKTNKYVINRYNHTYLLTEQYFTRIYCKSVSRLAQTAEADRH